MGTWIYALVIIVLTAASRARKLVGPGQLYARLDAVITCPHNRNENMDIVDMVTTIYGPHDFLMNGKFILRRDLEMAKFTVQINRCPNTVEASCEFFQTWRFSTNPCELVRQKEMPWAGLFRRLTPEISCPVIKKADYTMRNGTILVEYLRHLPMRLEHYYWRILVDLFDKNGFYGCYKVNGTAVRARN